MDEQFGDMALDLQDRLYIVGWTPSADFPLKNAYQPMYGGGLDGFLSRISDSSPVVSSPLTATPRQVKLRYVQGGSLPQAQDVQLVGNQVPFLAVANAAWVTVSPQSGIAPVTLRIGAAILTPGAYNAEVTLTPGSGARLTIPVSLTILTPAPVLTAVEPAFVALGSDDTIVTIRGSGFTPETKVRLYELTYEVPITFVDSTTLQFKMSYLSFVEEGTYRFSVVNPDSETSQPAVLSVGRRTPEITGVVNAASRLNGPIAPGELLFISGLNFGPQERLSVVFGDHPAAIIAYTGVDVTVIVPVLSRDASVALVVASGSLLSSPLQLGVVEAVPGLFTADGSGIGDALAEGELTPGSAVTLFGTGDGGLPVTAIIDGRDAAVESSGAVDGKPGWFQVRVEIPADAPISAPLAVVIKAGQGESQPGVTLTLR